MTGSRVRASVALSAIVLASLATVACGDLFNNLFKPSSESGSGTTTSAPTTSTPAAGIRVTAVTAGVDTGSYSGACPRRFTFTGTITASEPGTVTHKWERSDGTTTPLETLIFPGSGSLTVVNSWDVASTTDGWARVKVMSPNETTSNQARFVAVCQ
ncbi:MAG: hypothetical protein AB1806_09015 [Acidobacteriota bacterium]